MKTVLLVTTNEVHRKLYERGLARHFQVEFQPRSQGGSGRIDAVVYDIPEKRSTFEMQWLESIEIPVVVLTPELGLPLDESDKRRILTYPVRMDQIIEALTKLGIRAEDEA